MSADNNHVSTSKHYQLFPKQKLMQTNSLLTSMTSMFLSASVKQFIVQYWFSGRRFKAYRISTTNDQIKLQIWLSYKFEL